MGDRMLHRSSFAQRGTSALSFDLGSELVLKLFVLTDRQAAPLADPGCGTLRSLWTPIAGAGGELGVFAWGHWHGLATRTRDLSVDEVEGEVVFRKACPALRPGTGNDVDALLGPLRQAWTGHVPQVDIKLQQPWRLLQRLDQQFHRCMLWLVRWADHDLACDMTIQVQHEVFLKTVARFGAALTAVPHVRILNGDASIRGHMLLDDRAPMTSFRGAPSSTRRWCCSSHVFQRSTSSSTKRSACSLAFGCPQSRSSAALRLLWPTRTKPASSRIASADTPRARAARPTALRNACPSRFKVSSTRPAPNRGVESRAARSCRAPKPPVCSAKVTVRSSKTLSRLWAMSRRRKLYSVPWLKGGCSAPRQSSTICQHLSITVSSTASRSPT